MRVGILKVKQLSGIDLSELDRLTKQREAAAAVLDHCDKQLTAFRDGLVAPVVALIPPCKGFDGRVLVAKDRHLIPIFIDDSLVLIEDQRIY